MRFRFCGDADCPDWVLAEINNLSKLSSIKLKLLGQVVADSSIDEKGLNIEKVKKLLSDSKLDNIGDLKATVACINFIINSAVRHNCDETALASELQQLGLPQEHSQALRRVYVDRQEALTKAFRSRSLRINQLEKIQLNNNCTIPDCISLQLTVAGENHNINIRKEDAATLLRTLKSVRSEIQNYTSSS